MERQGRRTVMLDQLADPGGLFCEEILQRQLTGLDHIERLLPDGGGGRVRYGGR